VEEIWSYKKLPNVNNRPVAKILANLLISETAEQEDGSIYESLP
jgi:hypothetical protein